jgi:rhamnosyl/mannosyltransferase
MAFRDIQISRYLADQLEFLIYIQSEFTIPVQKPNVLLINKYYSPSTGGIETAVRQYAHWYKQQGHQIQVLSCAAKRTFRSRTEQIEGITVLRAASFGNLLSVPLSPLFFWHFTVLSAKAGIVHINLQFPLASMAWFLARKLIKGKTVVSYHCDVYRQRHLKKITYFFDRYVARHADLLMTGSPPLKERSEVLSRIDRNVEILPYAVDLAHIAHCLDQPSHEPVPEHFAREGYCVFFGRLVSYKGVAVLEKAIRRLAEENKPVNLVVFGVGPEEQRIRKLAKDYPTRVHFINTFVSSADKYQLIRNSQMLLFPSVYYSEAFGIAQLDAMACARPILNCWLNTGVNWVAPNGEAAITVGAGDAVKLADAIDALHKDPSLRAKLGDAGQQRCRAIFSEDVVRAHFAELINKL